MPDVYAVHFTMSSVPDYAPDQALSAALQEWVRMRCPDAPTFDVGRPVVHSTQNQSILRWEPYREGSSLLAEFVYRHPHVPNPAITWSTTVSFLSSDDVLSLDLKVANTGPDLGANGALLTTRPRLLLSLREFFSLSADGEICDGRPRTLSAQEMPSFVRYDLFDPERSLPVLVVTPERDGSFSVDCGALASDFMSLAKVVVIDRPEGTFPLTQEVGSKALSCFHGAARLYLPGLTKESDPRKHPLLFPRRLQDDGERLKVAKYLALLTTRRFFVPKPLLEERDRLRDQRALAYAQGQRELVVTLERNLAEARKSADVETIAALYQADCERLKAENEDLGAQVMELEGKVRWLETERTRLMIKASEVGPEGDDEIAPPEVETVEEAVQTAAELYADQLLVLPRAIQSAGESPYRYPAKVLEALSAMAKISEEKAKGSLGAPLEEVFRLKGLDYGGGIVKSTSRKHRRQYSVANDGEEYWCEEHIKLGVSRDPAECLRIYFTSRHKGEHRFVVAHVGEHFDTKLTD